jgi:hypothetical protein
MSGRTLTCADFEYTGVSCCAICHDPDLKELELRKVKIDGKDALLCCSMISFFYPHDPCAGMPPERKLLRAIFGAKADHA